MMIIKPKIRGFICVTAHPVGCEAHVEEQIAFVKAQKPIEGCPKRVLVVGASTGYGLASRIVPAFSSGASTVGVFYERPYENGKPGTPGWYNSAAFEKAATREGLYAKSINGDAFSDDIKKQTIDLIKADLGQIDVLIYSLASPRRTHPKTGLTARSVLKPIGESFTAKTVDPDKGIISDITIEPATELEQTDTVLVMGGEDWKMWVEALQEAGVLADNFDTVAYSYIGPELTWEVYRNGTIGRAKEHLEATAKELQVLLKPRGGRAYVSVNKALVTQASSAIPVVPLYISILYKLMKEKGTHEGCIEQVQRLFATQLYNANQPTLDDKGRIRVDDWEMLPEIQQSVKELWPQLKTENLAELSDIAGYREEFLKLFGFGMPGVDYDQEVEADVRVESIAEIPAVAK